MDEYDARTGGSVGDVSRLLGGNTMTPPVDLAAIRGYFERLKGFPQIKELMTIITGGVPVIAETPRTDSERALRVTVIIPQPTDT